jgi:hypothetical protein
LAQIKRHHQLTILCSLLDNKQATWPRPSVAEVQNGNQT